MDAAFSEEQRLLQEMAMRVGDELAVGSVDALGDVDATAGRKLLASTGLLGLHAPEDCGGGGASAVEVAVVAEALARRVCAVPFVGPVLAVELLATAGGPEAVAGVVDGSIAATVGLAAGLHGPAAVGRDRTGVAWDACGAGHAVVFDGPHAVALALKGVVVDNIDLSRVAITFDLPSEGAAAGNAVDERFAAFAIAVTCADMVGAMAGALDMAVDYAKDRVQFGRPIGSFQAIQHLCAEQYVSLEAARTATYYAAWAVDALAPSDALVAARVAKAYTAREAPLVAEANLQVHGGVGQSWESFAHVYLRRILGDAAVYGDEYTQLDAITTYLDTI
jgi:alkylation response protein AidB-like acyl-CoA dehydrogenase